jgi:multicomponent Na+:H+ antiporter subunit D
MLPVPTPLADWLIVLPVLLPLLGAALLVLLRAGRDFHGLFAGLVALALLAIDAELLRRTLETGPVAMTMGNWLPPFGISFTVDAMGAGFALVAAGVALTVLVYAQMDLPETARRDGFYPLVLLLLAGVSGAFLTGDLFNLYVWFEVMLIASFGLMVLGGENLQLDGTIKYGFLNFIATGLFLLAVALLYGLTGTLNMSDLIGAATRADAGALTGIGALFLLAFGLKAAAFPVNGWLPASYHTPPPAISALLGGLLTKVGVYALLRTLVMLLPATRETLAPVLAIVAALTLLLGPLGAIAETNLRRALGFLVIGGIGAALAGIALADANGIAGTAAYIVHALLTVTGLYLVAGLVEKATGAADTRAMGGLYAASAPLSILFLVLVLAISGVPPFLGFWPKLLLLESGIDRSGLAASGLDLWALLLVLCLLANALLTLIAGTRLWAHIFWRAGPEGALAEAPNPKLRPLARRERWFGLGAAAVLTGIVAIVGFWPQPLLELVTSAARDLGAPAGYVAATGLAGEGP